eukprot:CAMPEP_0194337302 /NCGR_PEP_ID=MMETSP0171-20130528/75881_1 /TAXON_ID=218684 /ORGANISM="Corethron pennatum, Strain L29A3" /LENGTH=569 /DNA_ID=CAMNT_0039101049 /DNA_START=52 /DNA_END=1761 /DNA_ORIENTATION=-
MASRISLLVMVAVFGTPSSAVRPHCPFATLAFAPPGTSRRRGATSAPRHATTAPPPEQRDISTVRELDEAFSAADAAASLRGGGPTIFRAGPHDDLLSSISVVGRTQSIGDPSLPDFVHPVVQLLHSRRRSGSLPTDPRSPSDRRADGARVALAIEGGGMRGCVSAGMAGALNHLNLTDAVDIVYGSSAGSLIGAYFLTRQLPWFGPEVYYDSLTTAGRRFIDTRRLMRTLGLGLLNPRLLRDVLTRRMGKPVLDLSYLLVETVQFRKPLNWTKFLEVNERQPLKIVASNLRTEQSVVLGTEEGSFSDLAGMAGCMHASMLLPGIAGPVMGMTTSPNGSGGTSRMELLDKYHAGRRRGGDDDNAFAPPPVEPLVDALLYEPLPYISALAEGATHVVVLRTRKDGVDVSGKSSIFERLISFRFLMRKNKVPAVFRYMRRHAHKKRYAEDVLLMNHHAMPPGELGRAEDEEGQFLLPIALPPAEEDVVRLETRREAIFHGVRMGFARAYDALVEDVSERGRGWEVARECYPDEIMEYDPNEIDAVGEAAFAVYLKKKAEELRLSRIDPAQQ